jgi:ankyrin repeat protein
MPEDSADTRKRKRGDLAALEYKKKLEQQEWPPLYHAAATLRLPTKATPQMIQSFDIGLQVVQVLLDHGADPFAKFLKATEAVKNLVDISLPRIGTPEGYEECSTLHKLLLDGKVVGSFLYIPGLDVNRRDAEGRTLLHAACSGAGPDGTIGSHNKDISQPEPVTMFHKLISLGADLGARDNFGRNVLHYMIGGTQGNGFDQFQTSFAAVLDQMPELVSQADGSGKTPLHYAVVRASRRKSPKVAKLLLSAGADPLAIDRGGNSVLHMLAWNLDTPVLHDFFQDLVGLGLEVNARNLGGETPLFTFYRCNDAYKSEIYDSDPSETIQEGRRSQLEARLRLQKVGADIFARDGHGRGLLHVVASKHVELFKELMELGLDAMLEDDAQQTALDVAAACGNQEVMTSLMRNTGRIHETDEYVKQLISLETSQMRCNAGQTRSL